MLKILSRKTLSKLRRTPLHAVGGAAQKLRVELAASLAKGRSPAPRNLTFFLTYRCNLRCSVCGQWGDEGYVKKLPPAVLRLLVRFVASLERRQSLSQCIEPEIRA